MDSTEKMTIFDDGTEEPHDETPIQMHHEEIVDDHEEDQVDSDETPIIFGDHSGRNSVHYAHHMQPPHQQHNGRNEDSTWIYATFAVVAVFLFFVMQRR